MKTVADLKRRMIVGTVVHVENARHPHLTADRTVLVAQSNRWALSIPDTHPDPSKHGKPSWLDIPRRSECEFNGDSVTIGGWLTLTLPPNSAV